MKLSQVRFIHSINYFTRGTNVQKTSLTSQDDTLELTHINNQPYVKIGSKLYVPLTNVSIFEEAPPAVKPFEELSAEVDGKIAEHKNKGGRPPKNSVQA